MRKTGKLRVSLLLVFLLTGALPAFATVEYARETGKDCGACHLSALGGGELTAEGLAFRQELQAKGLYKPLSTLQRIVRLIIGYVHMFTAVLWFGTILYVHIVLRPAYAAGGLPKGELRVGWLSMLVLAVTGTLLAIARAPSFEALYRTRFGVLLTIKVALFLVMVTSAMVVTLSIGPKLRKKIKGGLSLKDKDEFTPEELSRFDGKEGRPALIAFEGKVYDVTKSRLWKEGGHLKKHAAGLDLTESLKGAPHGPDKIFNMPLAGRLMTGGLPSKKPGYVKLFYFFAYMNLFFVFLILFIISLWRWW
jgi:predicted heme/steroid binding protein/uncharacterized membrane protein